MELIAPLNDSDNRSEAVSVGNGGSVFSTGGAMGVGAGATFCVGGALAALAVGAGAGLGAVVGMAGKEINVTSMARKGCLLTD